MKEKIFIAFVLAVLSLYGYNEIFNQKMFKVKITFCDSRSPVFIYVKQTEPRPSSEDIKRGYGSPTTEYEGYINVCDVQTIN